MRRICSGGALAERDLTITEPNITALEAQSAADATERINAGASAAGLHVDESLVAPANEECPICMDAYEEPAVTTCNHWYCKVCIINVLQSSAARCPLCRGPQRVNQLRCGITASEAAERLAAENEDNDAELAASQAAAADVAAATALAEREAAIVSTANGVISESKLAALLKSLRAMRRADPTAKALIFSQYNSTIEWLKGRLTREGFGHRHISGSMPLKQRAKAIQAFQGDPPTTVFLLSMRSGAVGINLTAASHVFLLEPALNPALEDQAVGRAWRMGQRREVKVVRFYVKGSVEEQIMEVVKIRQTGVAGAAAANANNDDQDAPGRRGQYRPHIRVEDQAGSIKEDKQNLRLNELQALFKTPEFPPPREDEGLSEDDEPMPDAGEYGNTNGGAIDYVALYERNNRARLQQQQVGADDGSGAGTSAMHAAMGNGTGGGIKVKKNRMRRSKAGIASVAGANNASAGAATTTPDGALNNNAVGAAANGSNPADANGNGNTANGVTPAATLHGAPATAAPSAAAATQHDEEEDVEDEEVEMAPAAILQRIKLLAQKATGRLTPAVNGSLGTTASQRTAAVKASTRAANVDLADQPDTDDDLSDEEAALNKMLAEEEDSPEPKGKRGRGRPRNEAITAHIPNPTPENIAGGSGSNGGGGGGSANGRPARRAVRPNYAVLANQGSAAADDNGAV
jgi:superfamily II DNA/RNA helicase